MYLPMSCVIASHDFSRSFQEEHVCLSVTTFESFLYDSTPLLWQISHDVCLSVRPNTVVEEAEGRSSTSIENKSFESPTICLTPHHSCQESSSSFRNLTCSLSSIFLSGF